MQAKSLIPKQLRSMYSGLSGDDFRGGSPGSWRGKLRPGNRFGSDFFQPLEARILLSGDAFGASSPWHDRWPTNPVIAVDMSRFDRAAAIRAAATTVEQFNAMPVMSISDAVAVEGSNNFDNFLAFTVTLSEAAVDDVVVDYEAVSGTALPDFDYDRLLVANQVLIPAGQDTANISVRTVADNVAEPDQFLLLN